MKIPTPIRIIALTTCAIFMFATISSANSFQIKSDESNSGVSEIYSESSPSHNSRKSTLAIVNAFESEEDVSPLFDELFEAHSLAYGYEDKKEFAKLLITYLEKYQGTIPSDYNTERSLEFLSQIRDREVKSAGAIANNSRKERVFVDAVKAIVSQVRDDIRYSRLESYLRFHNKREEIADCLVRNKISFSTGACIEYAIAGFILFQKQAEKLIKNAYGEVKIIGKTDNNEFRNTETPVRYYITFETNSNETITITASLHGLWLEDVKYDNETQKVIPQEMRLPYNMYHIICCIEVINETYPENYFAFSLDPGADPDDSGEDKAVSIMDINSLLRKRDEGDNEYKTILPNDLLHDTLRLNNKRAEYQPGLPDFGPLVSRPVSIDEITQYASFGRRTIWPEVRKGEVKLAKAKRTSFITLLAAKKFVWNYFSEMGQKKTTEEIPFDDFKENEEKRKCVAESLGISVEEYELWVNNILEVIENRTEILKGAIRIEVNYMLMNYHPYLLEFRGSIVEIVYDKLEKLMEGSDADLNAIKIINEDTIVIEKTRGEQHRISMGEIRQELQDIVESNRIILQSNILETQAILT